MTCVIARRGDASCHPENTLAAFNAVSVSGAHGLECDIQFSRDLPSHRYDQLIE